MTEPGIQAIEGTCFSYVMPGTWYVPPRCGVIYFCVEEQTTQGRPDPPSKQTQSTCRAVALRTVYRQIVLGIPPCWCMAYLLEAAASKVVGDLRKHGSRGPATSEQDVEAWKGFKNSKFQDCPCGVSQCQPQLVEESACHQPLHVLAKGCCYPMTCVLSVPCLGHLSAPR